MDTSQKRLAVGAYIILVVCTLFFLGRVRYRLNPFVRYLYTQYYIKTEQRTGSISAERFWEYRDMMSDVPATFEPQHLDKHKPFLSFKSLMIDSEDRLVRGDYSLKSTKTTPQSGLVFASRNGSVWLFSDRVVIEFLLPLSEMLKANGYFRFYEIDLAPYQDRVWHNRTVIKL